MARGRGLGAPRGRRAAGAAFLAALLAAALGGARAQCGNFACPGKKCKKACNSVSDCGWAGPKGAGDAGCVPLAQFCSAFKKKKGCGKHKKKCSWDGSTCSAGGSPPAPTPNNADRACGALSTKDARVFGPVFWKAIHIIGQWVTSPSDGPGRPEMTEHCVKFVSALPLMLPCAISGANFLDYVKSHPLINQVCDSKKNFVTVMVDAQNHISSYTTPGRKAWTEKDADDTYRFDRRGQSACRHSGTWNGQGGICKGYTGDIPWFPGVFEGLQPKDYNNVCQTYAQGVANTPPGGVSPYVPIPPGSGTTGSGAGTECWGGLKGVEACAFNSWAGIDMYPWMGMNPVQAKTGPGKEGQGSYWCSTPEDPIPTIEATSFGPALWPMIHQIALWYPEDPRDDLKVKCEEFIQALPAMIPCNNCANDFLNFQLRGSDPPGPDQIFPPGGVLPSEGLVKRACSTKDRLFEFFVQAHNNVNRHTNPLRIAFTIPQAKERHEVADVCFHNAIWPGPSGKALCRSKSDSADCIPYSFP